MSELIQLTKELHRELFKMTADELKDFRATWLQELERKNNLVTNYCMDIIDRAIAEKEGAAV